MTRNGEPIAGPKTRSFVASAKAAVAGVVAIAMVATMRARRNGHR